MVNNKMARALAIIAIGAIIWFIPTPQGLTSQSWHLFAIVVSTIVGFILHPLPMGAIAMLGITITALLGTLKLNEVLSGFSNDSLWLILCAFFFSRGFIKTGLGKRIAYGIVKTIGSKSLRLGYALALSDLILGIVTPSSTARMGGILYPIVRSLNSVFGSEPGPTSRRIGAYLLQTVYQSETATCAMFLTSMAANPYMASVVAKSFHVDLSWGVWALAASVPGLISLLVLPYFLHKVFPPEIESTPEAKELAVRELTAMGPMSVIEKILLIVMLGTLLLWATSSYHKLSATLVAMCAISALLICGVLDWKDIKTESGAWDTLIWMGCLISLAGQLTTTGFIPWFGQAVAGSMSGIDWKWTLIAFLIIYLYSHYLFASTTAHAIAMYAIFVTIAVAAGGPTLLVALSLAFVANYCLGLTHYSAGAGPIFFGAGYVELGTWWKLGFYVSLVNIVIWVGIGSIWWKIIGLW